MRKSLVVLLLLISVSVFAQERKPVVGLVNVESNIRDGQEAAAKLHSYLGQAIVNSKRFEVIERNDSDMSKLMGESVMQEGALANFKGLDFLLVAKIIDFKKDEKVVQALVGASSEEILTIGLELKFIDVENGRIVIQKTIREQLSGGKIVMVMGMGGTDNQIDLVATLTEQIANNVISNILDTLYPVTVLAVSSTGSITIANNNFVPGTIIEVIERGPEIIDPYSQQSLGCEEISIGQIVVYQVNGLMAKATLSLDKKYKNANIKVGMLCRDTKEVVNAYDLKKILQKIK